MSTDKFPITGEARTALGAMCMSLASIVEDNLDDCAYRAKVHIIDDIICFDVICSDEDGRLFILPFRYGDASDELLTSTTAYFLVDNNTKKGMGVLKSMKSGLHSENKRRSMINIFNGFKNLLKGMNHFAKPISKLYFDIGMSRYHDCYAMQDPKDHEAVKIFLVAYGADAHDEYGFADIRRAAGDEFVDY